MAFGERNAHYDMVDGGHFHQQTPILKQTSDRLSFFYLPPELRIEVYNMMLLNARQSMADSDVTADVLAATSIAHYVAGQRCDTRVRSTKISSRMHIHAGHSSSSVHGRGRRSSKCGQRLLAPTLPVSSRRRLLAACVVSANKFDMRS
jgi:hypothetical protein